MDDVPQADSPAARPWRYSRTAIALHWLLAILITLTTAIGWRMMWIEHQPGSEQFFDLHTSSGLTIAAPVVVRVLWRLTHPSVSRPAGPAWEARLASATHALLYVLIVAL